MRSHSAGQGLYRTRSMRRKQHESGEQAALFSWARIAARSHPELALLHAIPNGGKRDAKTAARMKREGQLAGVPDIYLPVARHGYHGLYLEIKRRDGGSTTEAQSAFIDLVRRYGYRAEVCHGWTAARDVILGYLGQA